MMGECQWCNGEGYVPCEECNDPVTMYAPLARIDTAADVHKKEVGYWEMVKQEIEVFNQHVIGRG